MPNVNVVMLAGHLGQDPEIRYSAKGTACCRFSMAVTRYIKAEACNEFKQETLWIQCTCFSHAAEKMQKRGAKGASVMVQGYLKEDRWNDKESGKEISRIVVVADKVSILKSSKDKAEPTIQQVAEEVRKSADDDDCPF